MDDAVTRALRACIVPVRCRTPQGPRLGSGFHVAPHLLLTCAHVVDGATAIEIRSGAGWQRVERLGLDLPSAADVALLRSDLAATGFARLGRSAALRDPVRAVGFPVRKGAPHEEQITGAIEDLQLQHVDEPWKSGARLIKFKDAQVREGFSGSPLYDDVSRRVVGIVAATRDRASALGGLAVPAGLVLDAHAGLRQAQRDADWDATIWRDPPGAESAFLDHYLDARSPFFGRVGALDALDAWFASGSPRALLVADAGRGKSSLLARWFDRLRRCEPAHGGRLHVALVPISIRFRHSREAEVVESLGRHVAGWHPGLRVAGGERRWRDLIADGLRIAAPAGEQFLLLVDGLDETVGWHADANLFPRRLGSGVRILATARRMAGRDVEGWCEQLGWPVGETTPIALGRLAEADLCEAAAAWWGLPRDRAGLLGKRLHALSGGDPLVAGLYLSSFGRGSPPAAETLADLSAGLDGVFERWWKEQAEQRQSDAAAAMRTIDRHLFDLLAGAFEPVPRQVLLAVLRRIVDCSGDEFDTALAALARFVVGDRAGYALGHPELARWRWRRLQEDGDAQRCDRAFVDWARALVDDDRAAIDAYALHAYARHVERLRGADLGDWQRITSAAWREHHQRSSGWPAGYAADLALARSAARAADAIDLAAGRTCRGLPLLAAAAFGRVSIERLRRRVPARLAAEAVRLGLWTPARAFDHVLAAHGGDFPRIAALGVVAAALGVAEIERAMATLAVERDVGFDWDDTLGVWHLAAAAARSGGFDESALDAWARSLQGIGAAIASFSIAAAHDGAVRSRWLESAIDALPADPGHGTARTRLALGIRIGECFALDELQCAASPAFGAWDLGTRLGFDWDATMQRTGSAAAALRIAWRWLGRSERARCAAALVAELPGWVGVLQTGVDAAGAAPSDERWSIAHGDWGPRLGALWDVCSIDLARQVFRRLRRHFETAAATGSDQRTAFTAMLRFGSRLARGERRFGRLPAESRAMAFGTSTYAPEVRDLYAAAASLGEWREALSEQVHLLRRHSEFEAVEVLEAIAPQLPDDLLERHWQAVGGFGTDWRERTRRALLASIAARGEAAARLAIARADEPDLGVEHLLLDAVVGALRGEASATQRDDARRALGSFPADHGLRAQLLSAVAAPLAPWSLDAVDAWCPKGSDGRSLAIGWLLPHVDAAELADAETPWRLAIGRVSPDTDAAAEDAIRIVGAAGGTAAALTWAAAMDEAAGEEQRGWTALAICALAPTAAADRDALVGAALAIGPATARAEACAALVAVADDSPRAWAAVESALRDAAALGDARSVGRILRRLAGDALRKGIEVAEVNTRLLPRSGSVLMWIDRARELMPWADPALVDRDFMPGGRLAELRSSTDRDLLRAALAPRLLVLGRIDDSIALAESASGAHVWRAHAAMLAHLADAQVAQRFVAAMLRHAHADLSLFAVGRELQRGACRARPAVEREICDALLDAADGDARLRLHLAVLAPVLGRLGGDDAVDAVAAACRPAPAQRPHEAPTTR